MAMAIAMAIAIAMTPVMIAINGGGHGKVSRYAVVLIDMVWLRTLVWMIQVSAIK